MANRPTAPSLARGALTRDEVLKLPPMVDIVTAGRALKLSRKKTYLLAQADEFPIPVERVGNTYRVRTADLHRFLGLDEDSRSNAWVARQLENAPPLSAEQRTLLRRLLSPDDTAGVA